MYTYNIVPSGADLIIHSSGEKGVEKTRQCIDTLTYYRYKTR